MSKDILGVTLIKIVSQRAARDQQILSDLSDINLLLLYFCTRAGVFTPSQAVRYLHSVNSPLSSMSSKDVLTALDRLVRERRWLGCLEHYRLPKDCGGCLTKVYYLLPLGKEALAREIPETTRFARKGRPMGVMRRRLAHDLLVTEAYLHVLKSRRIKIFLSERELKSLILKARWQEGPVLDDGVNNEATGDFMIYAQTRDGIFRWIECEVTRRLDNKMIRNKPDDMLWFVSEGLKKDVVETVKGRGAHVIVLGNVCEFCRCERCSASPNGTRHASTIANKVPSPREKAYWKLLTPPQQRFVRELNKLGAATVDALGLMLGLESSGIRKRVKQLEATGYIMVEKVHLHPGQDVGRRPVLCRLSHLDPLESLDARIHYLMVSIAVMAFIRVGFTLHSYSEQSGTLEMRCEKEAGVPPYTIVIDDKRKAPEEIGDRLNSAARETKSGKTLVFMHDPRRIAVMRKLCPGADIQDFSKGME